MEQINLLDLIIVFQISGIYNYSNKELNLTLYFYKDKIVFCIILIKLLNNEKETPKLNAHWKCKSLSHTITMPNAIHI